jgi:hypothetical protein
VSRMIARSLWVTVFGVLLPRAVTRALLLGLMLGLSLLALPLIGAARGATAPFKPTPQFKRVSQSAVFSPRTGEVTFRIVFNQVPDFSAAGPLGPQVDSFQYFIVGNPSLPYPSNYVSIIRGGEIYSTSDLIPIRNAVPPDTSDPMSGGWGTIRGEVPFTLSGTRLTFVAPLSLISNSTDAGSVDFRLETYAYGDQTSAVDRHIVVRR